MKKMMFALMTMLLMTATGKAMSYEQARNEALFLTDKMAYELNLTEAQYEAAYEINLDYLMGVTSYDDVYGTYWERRNLDLSYILLDWQLRAFRAATYFYRPLYWSDGFWHFAVYARYPHRDYFYYGRPVFYATYRGGHAWHVTGQSWYCDRRNHYIHHQTNTHFGMRDGWDRGDYRHHHNTGVRHSSTRTTVNNHGANRHHDNNRNAGQGDRGTRPTTTTPAGNNTTHSLGGSRSNTKPTTTPRQTSNASSPVRSNGTVSRSTGTTAKSSSATVRSTASRSVSGSGASLGRSSGATRSSGSGRSTGGGHQFGGRR